MKPDRKPVWASYWQWNPDEGADADPEVEAMDTALSVARTDEDRVMISVRGKVRSRWEKTDAAWLELTDAEAVRLIERLAAALGKTP